MLRVEARTKFVYIITVYIRGSTCCLGRPGVQMSTLKQHNYRPVSYILRAHTAGRIKRVGILSTVL